MKCLETFCYKNFPCKYHKYDIHGWVLGPLIYKKNDTVVILYAKRDDFKLYDCVIKCRELGKINESALIPILTHNKISHVVEFPTDVPYYGVIHNISWYVMRYYPRICSSVLDHKDFRLLLRTCLEFAKDLHLKMGYLYMDWRIDNILKKQEEGFVISDYEFLKKPSKANNTFIIDYIQDKDFSHYFLQRGANLDKPLFRYRTDLEIIGFLCIQFLQTEEPHWSIQCNKIRNDTLIPSFIDSISEQRDIYKYEFLKSYPYIQLYFEKIRDCSWDSLECMSAEWYDELISIFHEPLEFDTEFLF